MGRPNKSGLTREEYLQQYRRKPETKAKAAARMRSRRAAQSPEEKAEARKTTNLKRKADRHAIRAQLEAEKAADPEDPAVLEQALQEKIAAKRQRQRASRGMLRATGEKRFGQCPACQLDKDLVCDHCHKTGMIRGWICDKCNSGLAKIGDTLKAAQRARTYLETPL